MIKYEVLKKLMESDSEFGYNYDGIIIVCYSHYKIDDRLYAKVNMDDKEYIIWRDNLEDMFNFPDDMYISWLSINDVVTRKEIKDCILRKIRRAKHDRLEVEIFESKLIIGSSLNKLTNNRSYVVCSFDQILFRCRIQELIDMIKESDDKIKFKLLISIREYDMKI